MRHAIRMFTMKAPDTYSSDEFLSEEFNISKEDRRWAPENLHSFWLIDLHNEGKVLVTTSARQTQTQKIIKDISYISVILPVPVDVTSPNISQNGAAWTVNKHTHTHNYLYPTAKPGGREGSEKETSAPVLQTEAEPTSKGLSL